MSIGMPTENISISSFTIFPRSVCPAATTVAVTIGKNGAVLSSAVAAASSRCQDQLCRGKEVEGLRTNQRNQAFDSFRPYLGHR